MLGESSYFSYKEAIMQTNFYNKINYYVTENEPLIPSDIADEYATIILAQNDLNTNSYKILCKLFNYCSTSISQKIYDLIYDNCYELEMAIIFYAIKANIINKYSKTAINIFMFHMKQIDTNCIDVMSNDNPLKWIVLLCMFGFYSISEMIRFEKYFPDSKLLKFINHPDDFLIDDFREDWNFILRRTDFKCRYDSMIKNKEIYSKKLIHRYD